MRSSLPLSGQSQQRNRLFTQSGWSARYLQPKQTLIHKKNKKKIHKRKRQKRPCEKSVQDGRARGENKRNREERCGSGREEPTGDDRPSMFAEQITTSGLDLNCLKEEVHTHRYQIDVEPDSRTRSLFHPWARPLFTLPAVRFDGRGTPSSCLVPNASVRYHPAAHLPLASLMDLSLPTS